MAAASPTAKKKGFGLLVGILCGGGIVLLLLVGWLVHAAMTPEGAKVLHVLGSSHQIAQEGASAPGAAEVRKAGRCQQAMVMDGEELAKLGAQMVDGGTPDMSLAGQSFVMCIMPMFVEPPTCDALANTYVDAVHPDHRFNVMVQRLGGAERICSEWYDAHGNRLLKKSK